MDDTRHHRLLPRPGCLRKALVVGAGVAGLQTARQLLKLGIEVLVLEASADVGGVWMRGYEGYGLQIPWRQYQFPDFLWPEEIQPAEEYPSGQQVHAYIRAYARHFGLLRHIRFNCKLLRLRWCAEAREWEALYCDSALERFYKTTVDYTVICSGLFSHPFIPEYKGVDTYIGTQMHAQDLVDLSLAKGRRVVIVGAGKTALDCVCGLVASRTAASVTMLFRQAHWPLPRTIFGVSIRSLLFNRTTPAMLPPYYTAGRHSRAAHSLLRPLKRLFWRGLESASSSKFDISDNWKPRVGLPHDMFYGGQFLDDSTAEVMRCETLTTIKGEITRFVRNGVILQDGSFLPADLVLYCTGYTKSYEYFDGETRSKLGLQKDGLYLYRNCLPCDVPHLAFVGSEVSTYSNILTHGLQALWLTNVLAGRVTLPSPAMMGADVRAQQRWRRKIMPAQRNRGAVLMLYGMQYHDQLLRDMGAQTRRKGLNVFAECFGAYSAEDYADLMGPRDAADALSDDVALAAAAVEVSRRALQGLTSEPGSATLSGAEGHTSPTCVRRRLAGLSDTSTASVALGDGSSFTSSGAGGGVDGAGGGVGDSRRRQLRCNSARDAHALALAAARPSGMIRTRSEGMGQHRAFAGIAAAAAAAAQPPPRALLRNYSAGAAVQRAGGVMAAARPFTASNVPGGRALRNTTGGFIPPAAALPAAGMRCDSAMVVGRRTDATPAAQPPVGRVDSLGAARASRSRSEGTMRYTTGGYVGAAPPLPPIGCRTADGAPPSRPAAAGRVMSRSDSYGAARGGAVAAAAVAADSAVAAGPGEAVMLAHLVRSTSWDARGAAYLASSCSGSSSATAAWTPAACAAMPYGFASRDGGARGSVSTSNCGTSTPSRELVSDVGHTGPGAACCACGCGAGLGACAAGSNPGISREASQGQMGEWPRAAEADGGLSSPLPSDGHVPCGCGQPPQHHHQHHQHNAPPFCHACVQTANRSELHVSFDLYGSGGGGGAGGGAAGRRSSGCDSDAGHPPPCPLDSPRRGASLPSWHHLMPPHHSPCYRLGRVAHGERRPSMARLPEEGPTGC